MQTTPGLQWSCESPADLAGIAANLMHEAAGKKVFALYGNMGAGKTTFVKALCRNLGVTDMVASPTFTILNEYRDNSGQPIFHFDFYRIKSESEAFDLGYENYLYSDNYCFIEWPEKIASLLPPDIAKIFIEVQGTKRVITLSV
jgi:tRNA threonylcarbamoyladenosine biosynthesis protein TsaE